MALVLLNLAGSVVIVAWLYRRGRARNVLLCVAAVYVFMAFGPLVNLLMDETAYRGIVADKVELASTGFLLALGGLLVADLVMAQRDTFDASRLPAKTYDLLPVVLAALACYAVFALVTEGPLMAGADKLLRIELAGSWHYPYLLLETFAMALYVVARRTRLTHILFWINAALYLAYSLMTNERDFIFVGFALLVQRQLLSRTARSARLILFGAAGVVLASMLATLRENTELSLTQTLNIGSIPFVDTFVMDRVSDGEPFRHGHTYLDAVVSMLPAQPSEELSLSRWLVGLYARGSTGGYGFSLSGEAYLNFGLPGIVVVFFAVGLWLRFVVNRCDRSDFSAYLTVVLLATLLYALRGDSAQLLKTVAYGSIFFALLQLVSSTKEDPGQLRERTDAAGPVDQETPGGQGTGHDGGADRGDREGTTRC
jgi:hypothetical protein